jgi:hypothetical protein
LLHLGGLQNRLGLGWSFAALLVSFRMTAGATVEKKPAG